MIPLKLNLEELSGPHFEPQSPDDGFEMALRKTPSQFFSMDPLAGFPMPFYIAATLLLPVGATKTIVLVKSRQGAISVADKSILTLRETDMRPRRRRVLKLTGVRPGFTTLEVREGDKVVTRLEITVRPVITLACAFYFVRDSHQPTPHATRRTLADIKPAVLGANKILCPQTCIELDWRKISHIQVTGDWGEAVTQQNWGPTTGNEEVDKLRAHAAAGYRINVFFVWEFQIASTSSSQDPSAGSGIGGHSIIIEDDMRGAASNGVRQEFSLHHVLAHEVMHCLGIGHTPAELRQPTVLLMDEIDWKQGERIARWEADLAYQNAAAPYVLASVGVP